MGGGRREWEERKGEEREGVGEKPTPKDSRGFFINNSSARPRMYMRVFYFTFDTVSTYLHSIFTILV